MGPPVPVDVSHEGAATVSQLGDSGMHTHTLKLYASGSFSLIKTVCQAPALLKPSTQLIDLQFVIDSGEYEGFQAILIRPAKAFNFNGLPEEVRARVYRHYFAPIGTGNTITLEGKRKSNNEVYAKTYADGSKNRVALLAANKEIHDKALPIFYDHNLKFENTSTLMEFLSNVKEVRPLITAVTINNWVKTTSKTAMGILAESPRITRLRIESGLFTEGDPAKAAKFFYDQAYKFLEAVGAVKGDPTAGVDILSFGKQALMYKDDKKNAKTWSNDLVEDFRKELRMKLR